MIWKLHENKGAENHRLCHARGAVNPDLVHGPVKMAQGIDRKTAEAELLNWGRCIHDGWLRNNLGYQPPPTSEHYVAPVVGFDEPEPPRPPLDEIAAQRTSDIVVAMGMEHIDSYRVLVHWYCHTLTGPAMSQNAAIKRLSKFMHCSFGGAERMLEDSVTRYICKRLTKAK